MNTLTWQQLINFIPIAVIVSIIVFLVKFFGKASADQVPFVDNRSWHEELFGIEFFATRFASPLIFIFILYSRHWNPLKFTSEDLWLFVFGFISVIMLSFASKNSINFFKDDNFDDGNIFSFVKRLFNNKNVEKFNQGEKLLVLKHFVFPLVAYFMMVMLVLFYEWGSYYHLLIAIIYFLFFLLSFALLLSLKKRNILRADIKFVNDREDEIKDCRVLKINEDNIKVKITNNKVLILNKSTVSRIEVINTNNLE